MLLLDFASCHGGFGILGSIAVSLLPMVELLLSFNILSIQFPVDSLAPTSTSTIRGPILLSTWANAPNSGDCCTIVGKTKDLDQLLLCTFTKITVQISSGRTRHMLIASMDHLGKRYKCIGKLEKICVRTRRSHHFILL